MTETREQLLQRRDELLRLKAERNNPSIEGAMQRNKPNSLMQNVEDFNKWGDKYLAPIGAGAINAIPDIAANVGNLALKPVNKLFGTNAEIPRPHLERFLDPEHSKAAFLGGEIAGGLGPTGKIFGALGKIPGYAKGLIPNITKGAATGYAIAPDEHRNAGALLGGFGSLIPTGASLTSKRIGENVVSNFKSLKNKFNREYNSLWKEAEKAGVKNIPHDITEKDFKLLKNVATSSKQEKLLQSFIDNPSLKNTHDVQSSLGKIIDKLDKKRTLGSLDNLEKKALKTAEKHQDELRMAIYKEMAKKGGLDLPFKYSDLTNRYREKLGPYLDIPAIRKAAMNPKKKGSLPAEELPPILQGKSSQSFRANLGHEYPELAANKLLHDPLTQAFAKAGVQGLGLGGAGYLGYDLIKKLLQ